MDRVQSEVKSIELWRCVITECLSTLFYVLLPCLTLLNWQPNVFNVVGMTSSDVVYVALSFGFAECTLTQCFGHISGGHMNPAVTMATMIRCKVSPVRGIAYLLAQLGGGIAGAAILHGITPEMYRGSLGVTSLHEGLDPVAGFGVELLLTFTLVMTYCATTDPSRRNHGNQSVPMGLTVALLHLVGYRLTGSNCNPARSLGPAFLTNRWSHHWIYWAGPMAGGCVAGILYEYIFDPFRKTKTMKDIFKTIDSSTGAAGGQVYGFAGRTLQRDGRRASAPYNNRTSRGLENSAYESATMARELAQFGPYLDRPRFDEVSSDIYHTRNKY